MDRVFFTVICNRSDWSVKEPKSSAALARRCADGETYLYGLRVVEVSAQVHQQLGHPGGHVVGAGEDAGAQAQNASVTPHQVCGNRGNRETYQKMPS